MLESMKMETAVRAPSAGRVREIFATVNNQVDAGAALLRFDQAGETTEAQAAPRVQFRTQPSKADANPRTEALARLGELRALITGYDVSADRARILLAEYHALRGGLPLDDPELVAAELALLDTFADICEISRNRPTLDEEDTDERVHSPREHFHSFLHSLDAEVEGLPPAFRAKIVGALRDYDIDTLEPGSELEEAVYRLFLALQRMENQVPVITALLGRWLTAEEVPSASTSAVGEVLERLIVATQVRYPVIGDIARNLRFRLFDEPQIRTAREKIYDSVREALQYLADNPDAPDYAARIDTLVATPALLIDLLAQRISDPGPLLEVLTRQYYEIRALEGVQTFEQAGGQFVTGSYELAGEQLHLVSTVTDRERLSATLDTIDAIAGPKVDNLVVDIYLSWPDAPTDGDELSAELRDALAAHPGATGWRRVTVTVVGRDLRQVTFRSTHEGGLAEDPTIRDMHPLTGQRLDLWRLKNFNGTRLPAAAGTYLFHVVAKENPSDERLIALAEVRDVTPQLDEAGEVLGFPAIERTLAACLDGIRRVQTQRGQEAPRQQPRRALRVAGARRPGTSCPRDGATHSTADARCRAGGDHHPGRHQGPARRRSPDEWRFASPTAGRRGRRDSDRRRRPSRCAHSTSTPRRCSAHGPAAPSTPTRCPAAHRHRAARSSSTTSTTAGALLPVDRPLGHNTRRHRRRRGVTTHARHPEGHDTGRVVR